MITAKHLTKSFDGYNALNNITLNIEEGAVLGLVGSNGSGKSTLLRLIAGVYSPDEGIVGINGENSFDNPKIKSQIIFLADTPYFFSGSNLKEMANFYASMYSTFDYNMYNYLLSVFPLDESKRISTFSKGMRRQASLICALSAKPRYLLLDEAFDGLDVVMRRTLANLIFAAIEKENMTVVIASHNIRELEEVADHIALIHKGDIIKSGSIDDLCSNVHKVQAVFNEGFDEENLNGLQIIKTEKTGSVYQFIIRGEKEEISQKINSLSPIFTEYIAPSLEEIFVYELEVAGYDVKNIEQ